MSKTSGIFSAFLAGLAIGTGIGLLLAPDKGENTRRKVKETIDDLSEKGKKVIDEYKKKVETQQKSAEEN